jgi:hypothetical protein
MLHTPEFPMARMLVFWGGIENGFSGFGYRPVDDAKEIRCPTLLQYGLLDDKVSRKEIDAIFANINAPKKLVIFPRAGHDNYLKVSVREWEQQVCEHLDSNQ